MLWIPGFCGPWTITTLKGAEGGALRSTFHVSQGKNTVSLESLVLGNTMGFSFLITLFLPRKLGALNSVMHYQKDKEGNMILTSLKLNYIHGSWTR